jgi:hypothetical protein
MHLVRVVLEIVDEGKHLEPLEFFSERSCVPLLCFCNLDLDKRPPFWGVRVLFGCDHDIYAHLPDISKRFFTSAGFPATSKLGPSVEKSLVTTAPGPTTESDGI